MKRWTCAVLCVALCLSLVACGEPKVLQTEYDALQSQLEVAQGQIAELTDSLAVAEEKAGALEKDLAVANASIEEMSARIDDLENGPAALIVSIRNAFEAQNWDNVVALAEELHAKANGSAEDEEAQTLAADAQKALEKAAAEKAAEEAKGYETGLSYDQINRSPDEYKGQKLTVRGSVIQSFESGSNTVLMVFYGGVANCTVYVTIPTKSLSSRIIENDWVTIRGIANGIYTYQSSGRGMLSVPWVKADSVER